MKGVRCTVRDEARPTPVFCQTGGGEGGFVYARVASCLSLRKCVFLAGAFVYRPSGTECLRILLELVSFSLLTVQ